MSTKASKAPASKSGAVKTKSVKSNPPLQPGEEFRYLKLTEIEADPNQPRKHFDAAQMEELTQSIRERGVDMAILVRPVKGGRKPFKLVCGERRWRASKAAGLDTIPARIREMTDAQAAESQLVENTQRADMMPMEEAQAFENLRVRFAYSIDDLVTKSGKSEKIVRQRLRLIELPKAAQAALQDGTLRLGVANAIMWVDNKDDRAAAAHHILSNSHYGLMHNVHQAEDYIRRTFLLQLSKAPFNTRDAKLLPTAGSCLNCPKRTGAARALFEDMGVKDSCLDRACYQKKVELHREAQLAKFEAEGIALDEAATKKIFRYSQDHVDSGSGYVALDESVYQDTKNRSWGQLIGKDAPIRVAVNEAGKAIKVIERKEAVRLAQEVSGVELNLPSNRVNGSDALACKQAKARGQALNEYMVSLTAYIETIAREKLPLEHCALFVLLAKIALKNAPSETCRLMFKRRELPLVAGRFGGNDPRGALEIALDALATPHALLAFILELVVLEDFQFWTSASSSGKVEELQKALSELIGFDLGQSIKDFTKQLTAPKISQAKAKPPVAAHADA